MQQSMTPPFKKRKTSSAGDGTVHDRVDNDIQMTTEKKAPTNLTTVLDGDLNQLDLCLGQTFKTKVCSVLTVKNRTHDLNIQVGDGEAQEPCMRILYADTNEDTGKRVITVSITEASKHCVGMFKLNALCVDAVYKGKPFKKQLDQKTTLAKCKTPLISIGKEKEDGEGTWDPIFKVNLQYKQELKDGKKVLHDTVIVDVKNQPVEFEDLRNRKIKRIIFGLKIYIQKSDDWGFSRYLRKLEVYEDDTNKELNFI